MLIDKQPRQTTTHESFSGSHLNTVAQTHHFSFANHRMRKSHSGCRGPTTCHKAQRGVPVFCMNNIFSFRVHFEFDKRVTLINIVPGNFILICIKNSSEKQFKNLRTTLAFFNKTKNLNHFSVTFSLSTLCFGVFPPPSHQAWRRCDGGGNEARAGRIQMPLYCRTF